MPRELCIGNGSLLLNFDKHLSIRDLYFPHVGLENHVSGHSCKIGVWVDGAFSWIDDSWNTRFGYTGDTLVADTTLKRADLKLELRVEDTVHPHHDIFLRRVTVRNGAEGEREVRLFFSQDLHIRDTDDGITAYYDPRIDSLIHYKKDRYFMIGGSGDGGGLFEFSIAGSDTSRSNGAWRDAEDGTLSGNPVAFGAVDSVVSLQTHVPGHGEQKVYYWITAGRILDKALALRGIVRDVGPDHLMQESAAYHTVWVTKHDIDFGDLPGEIVRMFKRSLLILKTQIDNQGAIIASSDSDILSFQEDTYSYTWPRDGAFVSIGLDAAGYYEVSQRFYRFCAKVISKDGYLFPKYAADGSWGSNAHPWISPDGKFQLPIQEDETALVLYSLWNHYDHARDIEFIDDLYGPLIVRAADFLVGYRDDETKLPQPSYDLWEEQRGVSTFTASAVCCGLLGASRFANLFGDSEKAERYTNAADEVRDAILKHLYDPEKKRFLKMLHPEEDGGLKKDDTVDSSLYAIFEFEVLPPDDPRVISTMKAIESDLWVRTKVGGIARYENDPYQRIRNDTAKVPGNPWPLCTLWLAEWYIANGDRQHGLRLLKWVANRGHESGILPEQVNPETNAPLSVAPLTWSHSTFVITVLEYLQRMRQERACPTCGLPAERKKRGKLQE